MCDLELPEETDGELILAVKNSALFSVRAHKERSVSLTDFEGKTDVGSVSFDATATLKDLPWVCEPKVAVGSKKSQIKISIWGGCYSRQKERNYGNLHTNGIRQSTEAVQIKIRILSLKKNQYPTPMILMALMANPIMPIRRR